MRKYLKDEIRFLLFSEIYDRHSSPKAKRQALNILDSAIELFAKKGFHATTKKMIARHHGCSESLVTNYLGKLEDIQMESIKYTRYLFQSYVVDEMTTKTTYTEMFKCYLESCILWPNHFQNHTSLWISFLHQCTQDPQLKRVNTIAVEIGFERLTELIRLGKEAGEFTYVDLELTAHSIHLIITGLLLSNASEEMGDKSDARFKAAKDYSLKILNPSLSEIL